MLIFHVDADVRIKGTLVSTPEDPDDLIKRTDSQDSEDLYDPPVPPKRPAKKPRRQQRVKTQLSEAFGEWFRRELARTGLDQGSVRRATDFGKATISNWSGGYAFPTPENFDSLLGLFKTDLASALRSMGAIAAEQMTAATAASSSDAGAPQRRR